MSELRVALYPGTFDPLTNGHLSIIRRALKLFDRLVVGVALNPGKNPLFSVEARVKFIEEATFNLDNIVALPFDNLLIDFARTHRANVIIKGLRAVSDFERELQMGLMNRRLDERLETLFMIPSQEYSFLSSSFVKEIARHNGNIDELVPECVLRGLDNLELK